MFNKTTKKKKDEEGWGGEVEEENCAAAVLDHFDDKWKGRKKTLEDYFFVQLI